MYAADRGRNLIASRISEAYQKLSTSSLVPSLLRTAFLRRTDLASTPPRPMDHLLPLYKINLNSRNLTLRSMRFWQCRIDTVG